MWYDNARILSYNKILNFTLSNRGAGKTFSNKKWCISDFIKNGNQFVWMRRYKEEFSSDMIAKFFDDMRPIFPKVEFKIDNKTIYINNKIAGFLVPLSISTKYKSVPFPNVNKIIFDEFIIDKGTYHYLKNEVEVFLEFFETVNRLRDNTRAVFLANSISVVNPYFLYWHMQPNTNKRFSIYDNIAVELFADEEFIKAKSKTRFGQLINGTHYGDYAIKNQFLRDNMVFVEHKTPTASFMLGIKYNGIMYGFWVDYKAGYIYVNTQYDKYSYNLYCITKDDLAPNLLLIKSIKDCRQIQRVLYCFQYGLLRFDNVQVKNQFYEFIGYFLNK